MVHSLRKKNTRARGGTTHGYGSMKKHRGKGNKGGAGRAGTGKRGDATKPSHWHKKYFGKFGIGGKKSTLKTLNVSDLSRFSETTLDLSALGYDKLLGSGVVFEAYHITIAQASAHAKKKIADKGGEVKS